VHFLWQGALIGVGAFAVLRLGRLSAHARYTFGVATLGVLLAAPVCTFAYLTPAEVAVRTSAASSVVAPPSGPFFSGIAGPATTPAVDVAVIAEPSSAVSPWVLSWLVATWFAGVIALSVRFLGGWVVARRLTRRAVTPVAPEVQAIARRVAERLALKRLVSVFESSTLSVPVMVGWIAPAVLLPAAALAGLNPMQIEALLAHELAHVRRHDYLVNLLQSAVETLLFYHPAVWWMSRQVRRDRELCCDDVAVTVCDRLVYASALTELAALATPRFALAATDGQLVKRVRRILGQNGDDRESGSSWMPALILAAIVGAFVPSLVAKHAGDEPPAPVSTPAPAPLDPAAGSAAAIQEGAQTTPPATTASQGSRAEQARAERARADAQTAEAKAAAKADEAARRAQDMEMQLRGQAEQLRVAQAQLDELARKRFEMEMAKTDAAFRDRIENMQGAIEQAKLALGQAKDKFEKGLANQFAVAEAEGQVRQSERSMYAAVRERDFERQAAELKIREIEKQREFERSREQFERAQRLADVAMADVFQRGQRERLDSSLAELAAAEQARAGDTMIVDIAGEPDLPRAYEVRADGTIRLPLVGTIKVSGLTTVQAKDAIGKLLADRRLGSAADLTVVIRRRR